MSHAEPILKAIQADPRYQANLDWGQPRRGHPEGTIRAHIQELEHNLATLSDKLTESEQARLRLVIHTHDTFKSDAVVGAPISDPRSHASLARKFLAEFCDDMPVLQIVQFHDEPFALWRQQRARGELNQARLEELIACVPDWDLFLAFLIIDGCTNGKSREPLEWFFAEIDGRIESRFSCNDLI